MNESFEMRIAEIIKDHRNVPDRKEGLCAYSLSPRETILFKMIIDAYDREQDRELISATRDVATGDLNLLWGDGTRTIVESEDIPDMPLPLTKLSSLMKSGLRIEKFGAPAEKYITEELRQKIHFYVKSSL